MERPDGKKIASAFEGPWGTLRRTLTHMSEFAQADRAFFATNPGEEFHEIDEATAVKRFKFRFRTPAPVYINHIAADIVCNMRAALDQAAFGCAVAAGRPGKNAAFPFGDTAQEVASRRNAGSADVPAAIFDVMEGFRPYRSGNVALWAMSKLANAHKHRQTIAGAAAAMTAWEAYERRFPIGFYLDPPQPMPKWDWDKSELVWLTVPVDDVEEYRPQLSLFIAFTEPEDVASEPAVQVMNRMGDTVVRILMAMQDKASEIGILQ